MMVDPNKIVQLASDFLLERIDGEIVVHHPTQAVSLYLNDTGAIIWELCDGQRTVLEIIAVLTELYPENEPQIDTDVKSIIGQLVEHNMAVLK